MRRKLEIGDAVWFNYRSGTDLLLSRSAARVVGGPSRRGRQGAYVRIRLLSTGETFRCHPDRITQRREEMES